MKLLMQFGLCCLLAPGIFAAHQGGGTVGGVHGGGVSPVHNAGYGHRPIRAFGYGRYGAYGYGYGGLYWGDLFGGDYEPFYDYGNSPVPGGSNVTVIYPPQAPSITVAETAHPVIHEYTQPEDYGTGAERAKGPILYLIAFRDSTIRAAMTYWVENGTLHYMDTEHKEKQAPLSSVDRELSAQLNRERHVPFNIQ